MGRDLGSDLFAGFMEQRLNPQSHNIPKENILNLTRSQESDSLACRQDITNWGCNSRLVV